MVTSARPPASAPAHEAAREREARARSIAAAIFVQMLPATLVAPAVRPLFALHHAGREGAMHAFMSLNMIGAAAAAISVGWLRARGKSVHAWLPALAVIDAVLLAAVAAPLPTSAVLLARTVEGAAHVGAATVLVAEAAQRARASGSGRTMALAGAAIMFAVATGSLLGGLLVALDPRAPFLAGSALLLVVAPALGRLRSAMPGGLAERARADANGANDASDAEPDAATGLAARRSDLAVPVSAAFVGRFTVGCLVVSFALFAHRVHALSDREIGLLFSALTFSFALGMYPAGRVAHRVSRAAVLAVGAALYAATLLALGHVPTIALPIVMTLAGVASAMIFAPTLAYAAAAGGAVARTRAMALVNAAGCVGMLLGPAAGGAASQIFRTAGDPSRGNRAAFLVAAAAVALWLCATAPWLARRARIERRALPG